MKRRHAQKAFWASLGSLAHHVQGSARNGLGRGAPQNSVQAGPDTECHWLAISAKLSLAASVSSSARSEPKTSISAIEIEVGEFSQTMTVRPALSLAAVVTRTGAVGLDRVTAGVGARIRVAFFNG